MTILGGFLLFDPRLAVGFLVPYFRPPSTILQIAGFAITVFGVGFAVWARFFLGGNWSAMVTVKANHELIRSGPYAIVRHPIYSGVSLAASALPSLRPDAGTLSRLVLLVIAWRMEMGRRRRLFISQQFGEQYAEYKRHVHAFIPGIW